MPTFRDPPRAATLAVVLARRFPDATPGAIAFAVRDMQAAAKAAKAWGETCCNYPMTDAQQKRGDRRCERLEMTATESLMKLGGPEAIDIGNGDKIAGGYVAQLRFGGDPRGPCGRLVIAGERGDGWGDGYAIYT